MSNPKAGNALALIENLKTEVAPILAENGQSWDRLRTTLSIAVQQNPDILNCSPESIRREVMKCAADGLVPDNKEAAMIPYKRELQYQPMVHGLIKRMKELGGVFSIVVALVYENDHFEFDEADLESLSHKSNPFSTDRGAVVGGYCIFRDINNRVVHREVMTRANFEQVRKASKAPNSPAWRDWFEEMCKKAVLRRGAKYISIDNNKIRALIERQDAMFDYDARNREPERVNPFGGTTIEGGAERQIEHKGGSSSAGTTSKNKEPDAQPKGRQNPKADGKQEQKQPEKQAAPVKPELPDIFIDADLRDLSVDTVKKILTTVNQDGSPKDRQQNLKAVAEDLKKTTPDELRDLAAYCIKFADWYLKTEAAGEAPISDLTVTVMRLCELLEVERLSI